VEQMIPSLPHRNSNFSLAEVELSYICSIKKYQEEALKIRIDLRIIQRPGNLTEAFHNMFDELMFYMRNINNLKQLDLIAK
jgi:hypothetical protein